MKNSIKLNLGFILYIFFVSCNAKSSFFDFYKEFRIVKREPENLVYINRSLTELEKEKLIGIFERNNIKYKDTLGILYIDNREFYDDPKLFFWVYSDYLFDKSR